MAGMLPGVECARRRRFHQSGACSDSPSTVAALGGTRRSSFCLYRSNHEPQHTSTSSQKRSLLNQVYRDENLGEVAREAKERLDERLRTQRKSKAKSTQSLRCVEGRSIVLEELNTEMFGFKKGGSRRFSWAKLRWKVSDQDECAVCLEELKGVENLVHLPCAHRFHEKCLVPWLVNNAHCPCCRMGIISSQ
ncbi:probable E3 ubiquitin-protein ligase RHY1A [Juglans microcarpa x Juglans regia]|uniref:probable E3 ubiquitin-protein ligase RHY1A n=1 Tax=Juglans microcarpa x Juglans regia TaxID=2249226 RepID=UPI001B7F2120|nr:probable E3 ubiquitin-protein ligase RHY1A [Juglans microcarpa x Juglans regia]